jgi:hypothetical protein
MINSSSAAAGTRYNSAIGLRKDLTNCEKYVRIVKEGAAGIVYMLDSLLAGMLVCMCCFLRTLNNSPAPCPLKALPGCRLARSPLRVEDP